LIITRTPLRISLGGGGTDLPSYYRASGSGFLVAAAISKYVYVAVNQNFDGDVLLKYSQIERIPDASEADHPLLREAMLMTGILSGVEISSMADIPTGTGLGSSGSFTVGVLRALWAHKHETVSQQELARLACVIEIDRLNEPVGKQDQYIAAVGGIAAIEFHADESVDVVPLSLSERTHQLLEENLLLFYTGVRRSASEVLAQERSQLTIDSDLRESLHEVRETGVCTRAALEESDLHAFGELLTLQWKLKLQRQPTAMHRTVDSWIQAGKRAGAIGGKLVGAGGGPRIDRGSICDRL
jgi:D-glycero-alpha-D-manno-heptose-7-phosphate kinase